MLILVIFLGLVILVFVYIQFWGQKTDKFSKFLRKQNVRTSGKTYKWAMSQPDDVKDRIIDVFQIGGQALAALDEPVLENAVLLAKIKDMDYDDFFNGFGIIHYADPDFDLADAVSFYQTPYDFEKFARAWSDQVNANLNINQDVALKFVSKGRDFAALVNLDIQAKRTGLEIDEKRLINDVDDTGLEMIIYSLIRAKYEGIYLSDEESSQINKANVLEYNDTFKITQTMLKDLYKLGRNVTSFTNVMIRAHNSGIKINFSIADLYSMKDSEFDNLVTNIIRASDKGISIDQKDLIRQNIQGNDISNLISALIKSNEYGLDLTPDEMMNYLVNTGADVIKFVKAYNFANKNKLGISKDELIEDSNKDRDLFDYVQGIKIAKDFEKLNQPNFGITTSTVRAYFKQFGVVLEAINAVIGAQSKGLNMSFGLATQIKKAQLKFGDAISWAQNPQVLEVQPCVTSVCKNGVQVTPKVNITVRGKMPLFFAGYREDLLFKRINEAIISEFESADDHEHILQSLPEISQNVLNRINEEEENSEIKTDTAKETELNNHSAYQLLDVNIYDLQIGQNIKAELELRQAQIQSEMRKLKAEADRAKAEADIRIAMVQQYKDGTKPNFNELHKANLLSEKSDGISTGYNQAE